MNRILRLIENSRSGPVLYLDDDNKPITLGTLCCFVNDTYAVLQAAALILDDKLENGPCDEVPEILPLRFSLDYVSEFLQYIWPDKTADGRDYSFDGYKIVLDNEPKKGDAA